MSIPNRQRIESKQSLAGFFAFDHFCNIPSCLLKGSGTELQNVISFTLFGFRVALYSLASHNRNVVSHRV